MEENTNIQEQETQAKGTKEQKNETTKEQSNAIDYSKIEEMVTKGIQQKENGILKSYFSQQGLSEEEIKSAIEEYKTNKQNKEKETINESPELISLKKELETLKSSAQKQQINNAIQLQALGMGLSEKAVNAMLKIHPFDDIMDGDNISKEKVKKSIDSFLGEYEMFKPTTKASGFAVEIGAKDENPKKETEEEAMLKAIGLKK